MKEIATAILKNWNPKGTEASVQGLNSAIQFLIHSWEHRQLTS
jgi:hypothetical protein